jgi:putative endonuclease
MTSTKQRKQAYRYGIAAEKYAAAYLMCKGYRVLFGRYRNVLGEIDLLALKGDTLVAVEVKARRTLEQCEETVPPWKQQKISRAVEGLMAGQGKIAGLASSRDRNIRFDVIWIAPWRWPKHIKDAWRL